jgi:glycosyltransferase involved in cell wall biosynthesis
MSSDLQVPLGRDEKIIVAVDTWSLNRRFCNRGTYVYSKQILGHLRQLAGAGTEIRPFVSAAANNDANGFSPAPGFRPQESALLRFERLWRWGGGWLATCLQNPDVIFSPSFHTLQFASSAAKVVTVHDVTPVAMPIFGPMNIIRKLQFTLRRSVMVSDGIIASSERSKLDLMKVYRLPESKISVVYLGYDPSYFNTMVPPGDHFRSLLQRFKISRPFLFHHGVMQPRKNLKRLIEAHRLLLSRNPSLDLDLVLAGPLDWKGEELLESARTCAGPRGEVIFTGALPDADLAILLKGATLVVIPSLYEGFCLPMVEAMACGVPTVVANSSCLPEVSGGVLRYFNPDSVDEMAGCVEQVLASSSAQEELASRGVKRAQQFSWRRCAENTLAVLVRLAEDRKAVRRANSAG